MELNRQKSKWESRALAAEKKIGINEFSDQFESGSEKGSEKGSSPGTSSRHDVLCSQHGGDFSVKEGPGGPSSSPSYSSASGSGSQGQGHGKQSHGKSQDLGGAGESSYFSRKTEDRWWENEENDGGSDVSGSSFTTRRDREGSHNESKEKVRKKMSHSTNKILKELPSTRRKESSFGQMVKEENRRFSQLIKDSSRRLDIASTPTPSAAPSVCGSVGGSRVGGSRRGSGPYHATSATTSLAATPSASASVSRAVSRPVSGTATPVQYSYNSTSTVLSMSDNKSVSVCASGGQHGPTSTAALSRRASSLTRIVENPDSAIKDSAIKSIGSSSASAPRSRSGAGSRRGSSHHRLGSYEDEEDSLSSASVSRGLDFGCSATKEKDLHKDVGMKLGESETTRHPHDLSFQSLSTMIGSTTSTTSSEASTLLPPAPSCGLSSTSSSLNIDNYVYNNAKNGKNGIHNRAGGEDDDVGTMAGPVDRFALHSSLQPLTAAPSFSSKRWNPNLGLNLKRKNLRKLSLPGVRSMTLAAGAAGAGAGLRAAADVEVGQEKETFQSKSLISGDAVTTPSSFGFVVPASNGRHRQDRSSSSAAASMSATPSVVASSSSSHGSFQPPGHLSAAPMSKVLRRQTFFSPSVVTSPSI